MFWLGKSIKRDIKISDKKKKRIHLSPLEVIILIQLRSRELRNKGDHVGQYGYEMIQELNKLFGGTWEAKSGTIYPLLSKLKNKKEMITDKRKKSPLGPVKKVYQLENIGRKSIDDLINNSVDNDIDFILKYLNLISPFLMESETIFEKIMEFPSKAIEFAMENVVTDMDKNLQTEKLKILKKSLTKTLKDIEEKIKE